MLKVKKTHVVPAFREFRLEVELGECKAGQRGAGSLLIASAIISCEIQRLSRGTGQHREGGAARVDAHSGGEENACTGEGTCVTKMD